MISDVAKAKTFPEDVAVISEKTGPDTTVERIEDISRV